MRQWLTFCQTDHCLVFITNCLNFVKEALNATKTWDHHGAYWLVITAYLLISSATGCITSFCLALRSWREPVPPPDIHIVLESQRIAKLLVSFLAHDNLLLVEGIRFTIQNLWVRLFFVLAKLPNLSASKWDRTSRDETVKPQNSLADFNSRCRNKNRTDFGTISRLINFELWIFKDKHSCWKRYGEDACSRGPSVSHTSCTYHLFDGNLGERRAFLQTYERKKPDFQIHPGPEGLKVYYRQDNINLTHLLVNFPRRFLETVSCGHVMTLWPIKCLGFWLCLQMLIIKRLVFILRGNLGVDPF
jgi:hypothetical protein